MISNNMSFPHTILIAFHVSGRYFASSCFSLAVQVTSKRLPSSESESFMYYVNDEVYGSFNCLIHDPAKVQPKVLEVWHHIFKNVYIYSMVLLFLKFLFVWLL